ncbi:hypothetical protein [Mucilaginibacter ginsenosidivorans]|uniref:Uncharacterized protein n=1 Tax=Mucilaginibacter ginsenosidivorans TaxID=398053 RepID=A0A5B8UTU4_9SPHI|nr:hypothetical protein [Mucilaginibacter ginsenosidivorans]QEC62550.1 hypothetical protein FRZ54_08085 [Mucilaginibacter ginsenosidivorans]
MKRKLLIIVTVIILLSNLPFWDFFLLENYTYSNIDGTFLYSEEANKGKSFSMCERKYGVFLCQHPDKDRGDNRLYRTFTIKPWRFWQWRQFIFHSERFTLPYLEPPKDTNKP